MLGTPQTFSQLVAMFIDLISLAIPVLFSITLLVIIWKIVDAWILHPDDMEKIKEGRNVALIGVIALVIMSGIWGILSLLQYSLFGI